MGGEVALMMLSRAASSRARFRAAMQTRAPRFAAIDAIASPIPLLPPVTRTTLPCKDSAAGEQIEASPTRRAATRKIHVAFNANMMAKRAHGRSMTTPTRGVRGIMSMRKNNRLCASVVGSSGAFCLGVASSPRLCVPVPLWCVPQVGRRGVFILSRTRALPRLSLSPRGWLLLRSALCTHNHARAQTCERSTNSFLRIQKL